MKAPTAEETLNTVVGDGCNFRKLFGDNDTDWVIKAIESHTQTHTEGLRERVKELEEIISGINSCRMVGITWPNELKQKVEKIWEAAE